MREVIVRAFFAGAGLARDKKGKTFEGPVGYRVALRNATWPGLTRRCTRPAPHVRFKESKSNMRALLVAPCLRPGTACLSPSA